MFSAQIISAAIRALDWIALHTLPSSASDIAAHLETGRRGEEAAYFFLRRHGYIMVARNYRSPRRRGEIDLIGWDGDILSFIEVKTRTSHDVKPAEAAVDRDKQRELQAVAREFLRGLPTFGQWRFDIVSVYYEGQSGLPQIELFKNAFAVS
jgi:putative endonuclease